MTTVIIWHGNPGSGGTGYTASADTATKAWAAAHKWASAQHTLPPELSRAYAAAKVSGFPIVRLGTAEWSVEIRR
jgi:hypothetical protein